MCLDPKIHPNGRFCRETNGFVSCHPQLDRRSSGFKCQIDHFPNRGMDGNGYSS